MFEKATIFNTLFYGSLGVKVLLHNFLKKLFSDFSAPCYFRTHWKLYCPGCGGTRALFALMHGNLRQSLKYNPVTLLFLLDVLVTTILSLIEKKNSKYSTSRFRLILNISCHWIIDICHSLFLRKGRTHAKMTGWKCTLFKFKEITQWGFF